MVHADSEGLDGRKAAFVRSQPPQQLPPTWWTLPGQTGPAHSTTTERPAFCTARRSRSRAEGMGVRLVGQLLQKWLTSG